MVSTRPTATSAPTVVQMPGQQPQTIVQQPSVLVQPRPSAGKRSSNWKGLAFTGYAQVLLGVVSVLLGVVSIVFRSYSFQVGQPIWSGVCFFIVAGIFGIAAGRRKTKCLVVVYLVLAIIAAVVAGAMIIVAAIGMASSWYCPDYAYGNPYGYGYDFFDRRGCSTSRGTRIAISGLILLTGLVEAVFAVVGASFTCARLCCGKDNSRSVVRYQNAPQIVVAGQPPGGVQYVFASPQQVVPQPGNVMYVGQPVAVPHQPQFQPVLQHQGQVPYQPTPQPPTQYHQAYPQGQVLYQPPPQAPPQYHQAYPQGQVQPTGTVMQAPAPQGQGLAGASAPVDGSTSVPAPKVSKLPEDHDCKPLIT